MREANALNHNFPVSLQLMCTWYEGYMHAQLIVSNNDEMI